MKATPPALEKRRSPGRIRAILLAVGVHAAFFALIIFGVTWQSRPPPPVQAELWTQLPDAKPSPPRADPEPPPPEPAKAEPPKPEPKPEARPEAKPEPPKPDPKIAEKKEREKRELERREREKLEKQKAEESRRKREQEEAAKKKREQEEAAKKKRDEERTRREAEAAREAALNARQVEIQGYIDRIKARIRGRANVPDTVTGQPEVQVRIRILPGGDVLDIAVVRSSGNRIYDAAIERAIRSAQPLPVPPADSELFPQFRDLNLNIRHER